jgi:hypothetical protein
MSRGSRWPRTQYRRAALGRTERIPLHSSKPIAYGSDGWLTSNCGKASPRLSARRSSASGFGLLLGEAQAPGIRTPCPALQASRLVGSGPPSSPARSSRCYIRRSPSPGPAVVVPASVKGGELPTPEPPVGRTKTPSLGEARLCWGRDEGLGGWNRAEWRAGFRSDVIRGMAGWR